MYDFLKNFKPQVKNENLAIFGYFFSKMAEISRGRPLQGTGLRFNTIGCIINELNQIMNPKWKIQLLATFWLFFAKNGRNFERATPLRYGLHFNTIGCKINNIN